MGCGASSRPCAPEVRYEWAQASPETALPPDLLENTKIVKCASATEPWAACSSSAVRPPGNPEDDLKELRRTGGDPTVACWRSRRTAKMVICEGRPKVARTPNKAMEAFLTSDAGALLPLKLKAVLKKKILKDELEHRQGLAKETAAPCGIVLRGPEDGHESSTLLPARSTLSFSDPDAVSEIIASPRTEGQDVSATEARAWQMFADWCFEQLLVELFETVDQDDDGFISAEELMNVLVIVSMREDIGFSLDPMAAQQTLQEFDLNGNGSLSCEDFLHMVTQLDRENEDSYDTRRSRVNQTLPHLLLHFDVNNTVLITDSCTGQNTQDLIVCTLAGSCWGIVVREGTLWVLVCPEPRVQSPWQGLISYSEFVNQANPIPDGASKPEIRAVKDARRACLKSFVDMGQPGEAMRPYCERLLGALALPKEVRGSQAAEDAGLMGNNIRILPSFLTLLQELKKSGRKFSVVFRTFGNDLNEVFEAEFNAFCEGKHPLFPDGLRLDGSDGDKDHRLDLADEKSMGTFVRGMKNDSLALVWGTHFQPEPQDGGIEWYEQSMREKPGQKLKIIKGAAEVAASLEEKLLGQSKTLALRDFYDSWAVVHFEGKGGKPLFLRLEDQDVFTVFFDDALRPQDPTIVDPIDSRDYPQRVPMAQVFNIHLLTASPLHSISDKHYFIDLLAKCEQSKASQSQRRRKVGRVLHSIKGIRGAVELLGDDTRDFSELPRSTITSLASPCSREAPSVRFSSSHEDLDSLDSSPQSDPSMKRSASRCSAGFDHMKSLNHQLRYTAWGAASSQEVGYIPLPVDEELLGLLDGVGDLNRGRTSVVKDKTLTIPVTGQMARIKTG